MKKQYKNRMDACHAPEALKQQTIRRMKEEMEQAGNSESVFMEKREKPQRNLWQFVAAAAVLAMAVGIPYGQTVYYSRFFQKLPTENAGEQGTHLYAAPFKMASRKIDAEEYKKYLGIDFASLVEGYQMTESDIIIYYDKQMNWDEDRGTMTYQHGERYSVTLEVSSSGSLDRGETEGMKGFVVYHTEVLFTESRESGKKQLTAFWELDGIQYAARTETVSQKEFYKIIKKIIKNLEPFETFTADKEY